MNYISSKKEIVHRRWRYRESFVAVLSLVILGECISLMFPGLLPKPLSTPFNIYFGGSFLAALIFVQIRFRHHYLIIWLSSIPAAISAICFYTIWVLIMGVLPQDVRPSNLFIELMGFNHIKTSWPFLFLQLYMVTVLGLVTLRRLFPFTGRNIGFFLNHFGLWLIIMIALLGNGDLKRTYVNLLEDGPGSDVGILNDGSLQKLPFTLKLIDFSIEEYPAKLTLVDVRTNEIILGKDKKMPELVVGTCVLLDNWYCYPDTLFHNALIKGSKVVETDSVGSFTAAHIQVFDKSGHHLGKSWITVGNYKQAPMAYASSDSLWIAMSSPSVKKFSSKVIVIRDSLKADTFTIEVNKPLTVDGWKIYQASYDQNKGKWSNLSILEVVKDPWINWIYTGLAMLVAGSIFLFWFGKKQSL